MIWFALALGMAGGAVLGWYAHRWHCMRSTPSCPVWLEQDARDWDTKAELNGWRKRHHPTPVDSQGGSGVPLPNTNGVDTKTENPRRRVT